MLDPPGHLAKPYLSVGQRSLPIAVNALSKLYHKPKVCHYIGISNEIANSLFAKSTEA
jgi:hypothetical protein